MTELPGRLSVAPFDELDAVMEAPKGSGFRRGRYLIALTNRGNRCTTASLAPVDQDEELSFRPNKHEAELAPGERTELTFESRTRGWRLLGAAITLPFHVSVGKLAERPTQHLAGRFRQRSLLPAWPLALVIPILLAAAALALAGSDHGTDDSNRSPESPTPSATPTTKGRARQATVKLAKEAYRNDGWGELPYIVRYRVSPPETCRRISRHHVECPYRLYFTDDWGDEGVCLDWAQVVYRSHRSSSPRV